MKHYYNYSIINFLIIFLFVFLYYSFFKTKIIKEPIFYSYNNKIILTEEKYNHLLLKTIKKIEDLPENKVVLELIDGKKYIINKEEYNFTKFIKLFYVPLLISLIALLFSLWFYEVFQDFFFSIFFLLKSILLFLFILGMYYPYNYLYFIFWCITTTFFIISYVNLNIRFLGKSLNTFTLLLEASIFSIVLLILLLEDIPRKKEFMFEFFYQIFVLCFIIFIFINIIRIFYQNLDKIDKYKILSFVLGNLIGFLPLLLIFKIYKINMFIYLMFSAIYPFFIAYSLYRMYLVPSQLIITKTFITGILTLIFISLYFIVIYLYANYFPQHLFKYRIYYDLFFLIVLSLIIDPLRHRIFDYVKNRFLIPEKKYIISLMRLSKILARISRPNLAIEQFLKEIEETLNVEKCLFLFPPNILPSIKLSENSVIEIFQNDTIWKYVKPEKIIASTYIVYSTGERKRLFNFLYENKILLLFGLGEKKDAYYIAYVNLLRFINKIYSLIKKEELSIYKKNIENQLPNAGLLIGIPKGRSKFDLKEIRYLQEVTRLATMMLTNMYILFQEVDKRKKIRYIIQSGKFQKKLTFHTENFPSGINIQYFNQPVLSVSGDYVDIIPLSKNQLAVFLGDVSGHGLGTGYLVSAIRSIVHYSFNIKKSLLDTINTINLFLTDRYKGYEFFTLFAFILDISQDKIEYVNAAHPGIFIKPKDEPLYKIEKTQKLLGISKTPYKSFELKIKPGSRIFIFSDGVLETTNPKNELFGEKRLIEFLNENADLPLQEITRKLLKTLEDFRGSKEFQDDTTFLVIDYNPQKTIFDLLWNSLLRASVTK
ncbi:MAG: serine phosphatase [Leptospiraceae bacterium]|nr:MAG: serine phosphatase [Leptospiraceae bacterium]